MSSTIVLEELGGRRRRVVLEDSTLPERGLAVESRARIQSTWYPGASRASVQHLGTEERPFTLRGHLRDVWLGTVGSALAAWADLDGLLRGQQPISLTWTETQEGGILPLDQQPLVREGYITMLRPVYDRAGDIGYELEFTPTAADEAVVATAEVLSLPLPDQSLLSAILDVLGGVMDTAQKAVAVNNAAKAIL